MEIFLTTFTWDIILWAIASFWHSIYLIGMGFSTMAMSYYKIQNLAKNNATVPLVKAFETLVFGVFLGSVCYMAGNAAKNMQESVALSLGFSTHEYDSMDESIATTTVNNPVGITSTYVITADTVEVDYDFLKLFKMQENWFTFFAIQRGTSLMAPYVYLALQEAAIGGIIGLAAVVSGFGL